MTGIALRHHGSVLEIVMDAPPVNAFSRTFLQALGEAVRAVPVEVAAIVVTSAVPGIFAAGGDIPYMAWAGLGEQVGYVELCQDVYGAFEQIQAPTVAAVDGACLGGGLELALACDVRVVGDDAVLGLPEATLGILAAGGAIHRLVRAVGQGTARDLLLSGRRLAGREAVAVGLAARGVPAGTANAAALELAAAMAAAPGSLGPVKASAVAATDTSLGQSRHAALDAVRDAGRRAEETQR